MRSSKRRKATSRRSQTSSNKARRRRSECAAQYRSAPKTVAHTQTINRITASLPAGISQHRLRLLPRILGEWSRTDLREHLSREPRATVRKRYEQLTKVGKCANHLRQALDATDERGWFWIAHEIACENQPFSASREKVSEMNERLTEEGEFLLKLAAATVRLIEELDESLSGRRPRNIPAYLVMLDLAAIFEWLTDRKAARGVDRTDHTETGPFWRFAESVWPVAFGTTRGLKAAMKNWAKARKSYHEHSSFLLNLPLRRPEWGIFEH
jgi:hypothetical protein